MTSKTVSNNLSNLGDGIISRPISARPISAKSNRSQSAQSRPVIHEPCSSTLGKFHDGVNYSLINDPITKRGSNTPRSNHPVLEAKRKYKYMTNQKSYVDESLFGSSTSRNGYYEQNYGNIFEKQPDIYQYSRNHLTHDLMSNLAPLQIHAPLRTNRSNLNSARPDSARSRPDLDLKENLSFTKNKPELKPWRP
ncbi:unnamed protein product [Brachionus calyciflorus]|uniref:Uncharacterized protein n=1 Tax=Brachionus calyciflorus TaxID=104777 RepID=A0A813PHL1_9BILA|nr:unnamed protein product [Brachionus calyciflorus]